MIRASIARYSSNAEHAELAEPMTQRAHPSFARLPLLKSGDDDGACVIEPTVRCNHCGYCLSFGH